MEKKNNCVKVGFSTILWTVSAILLCAAPSLRADVTVPAGQTWDIDYDVTGSDPSGFLWVYGIANILPDAVVTHGLYVQIGGTANIYGGTIKPLVSVSTDAASVTVYGMGLAVDGVPVEYGEMTLTGGMGTLTGTYGDESEIKLLILSNIINLQPPPSSEPLEAQLWVFPGLINRYGRLSKIWAMVRLPEGITKDDIDSTQALVLYANAYDDVAIEASCQRIIQWCRNGIVRVTIIASFDKASLTGAVPDDGQVGLEVVGQLNAGQDFYGIDNVRIVSRYWWRR